MPLAHSIDSLIKEFKVNKASHGFYSSPEGLEFLYYTNDNQVAMTWEARYKDGTELYQYDEITYLRALQDEEYIPSPDRIISTDKIDKKKCVHYELHPIAYTLKRCPWFNRSYRVNIHPERGERLLAFWETDYQIGSGKQLRRHVLGIQFVDAEENEINRTVFIISPSGNMVLSGSTNLSIEGE